MASDDVDIKIIGVIGDPIKQSKSPIIQNYWIRKYNIPAIYVPFHVSSDRLAVWLEDAGRLGVSGFNVTLPHKEAVVEFMARLTPTAELIRSVNTVQLTADGYVGDSTDGFGFIENLKQYGFTPTSKKTVALIGAGGAARAVAAGLLSSGLKVRLANRRRERAEKLADDLSRLGSIEVYAWPPTEAFYDGADVIANGTPVGMSGQAEMPFSLPSLEPQVIATDMVYAPLDTPFLKMARRSGAQTVDGLGMLLHQARPGFARWFGVEPGVDEELRRVALSRTGFIP